MAAPRASMLCPGAQVESWGYKALPVSAASGAGLPELARALAGRVTVLAGPSGVGKSSLINALTVRAAGARPRRLASLTSPVCSR
jgi:putative ribosome biogenesis GTPase RsgA